MSDDNVIEFRKPGESLFTMTPSPINITFCDDYGQKVGEFWYDQDTGKWSFEGDMEESARKFLKFLHHISGADNG